MARKKSPVLYELLRRDHADVRWRRPEKDAQGSAGPPADRPQDLTTGGAETPSALRTDVPQADEDELVFHLTRTHAAIAAAAVLVALVVFAWIGSRAGRSSPTAASPQGIAQEVDTGRKAVDPAEEERQQPLAMILPEAGGDSAPEAPIRIPLAGKGVAEEKGDGDGEPSDGAATAALVASGDPRKIGLTYLVIQIIPQRPDAKEHAAEIRKFLSEKGIRTIELAGPAGGYKILSQQGFNYDDPRDRDRLERLTEAVKRAGKDYATARYAGRYDFRTSYPAKYTGK